MKSSKSRSRKNYYKKMRRAGMMPQLIKNAEARKKRAKKCIDCIHNNEGWCTKQKTWCGRCNKNCKEKVLLK